MKIRVDKLSEEDNKDFKRGDVEIDFDGWGEIEIVGSEIRIINCEGGSEDESMIIRFKKGVILDK